MKTCQPWEDVSRGDGRAGVHTLPELLPLLASQMHLRHAVGHHVFSVKSASPQRGRRASQDAPRWLVTCVVVDGSPSSAYAAVKIAHATSPGTEGPGSKLMGRCDAAVRDPALATAVAPSPERLLRFPR